ncbi:hypothetical protein GQ42DRAFT_176870 [Ramicandelaber brevisporus]|nr:hypothetical protein GQ42DRAFT_176870 [Ramicandelaber brevisporus]
MADPATARFRSRVLTADELQMLPNQFDPITAVSSLPASLPDLELLADFWKFDFVLCSKTWLHCADALIAAGQTDSVIDGFLTRLEIPHHGIEETLRSFTAFVREHIAEEAQNAAIEQAESMKDVITALTDHWSELYDRASGSGQSLLVNGENDAAQLMDAAQKLTQAMVDKSDDEESETPDYADITKFMIASCYRSALIGKINDESAWIAAICISNDLTENYDDEWNAAACQTWN